MPTEQEQSDGGTQDILSGVQRWRDWLTLGWYDFSVRHRRTLIGPFWQTVQVGIWVFGLALVFRHYEGAEVNYVAYVTLGVVFWNYFSSLITNGAAVFNRRANLILNVRNPLSLYVFRSITESSSAFAFQFLLYFVVLAFFPSMLTPATLMFFPGLLALMFTACWVVPLLGLVGSRYHDTDHIVTVLMRFLFFTSPVFWVVRDDHGPRALVAAYNPFTHFLEIVRTPLLGAPPSTTSWLIVAAISIPGSLLTFLLFRRHRANVVFWV